MFKCEFCNKNYSTKSILSTHQKTTKKCLQLRGENNNIKLKLLEYEHEYNNFNLILEKSQYKVTRLIADNINLERKI